jgi:hypothetical protein
MGKKITLVCLAGMLLVVAWLAAFPFGQRVDGSYRPRVAVAAYPSAGPRVLFDAAHHNAHTAGGRYAPLAKLLGADGYRVGSLEEPFATGSLAAVDVLVVANAAGGTNPQLFGINLVPLRRGHRQAPAFRRHEIAAVRGWVERGGSLLLVADHYPFGPAAAALAAAFGVRMHGGFVEADHEYPGQRDPSQLLFTRTNGLLADHPIARGRDAGERVASVMSFTGQSLDGPAGSALLRLPANAVDYVRVGDQMVEAPAGSAQAVAFECGRGRVAVLGEAALLTAQRDDQGKPFGMQLAEADDERFARNLFHWLSRLL